MLLSENQIRILGLTNQEANIVESIDYSRNSSGIFTLAKLCKTTGIPRMSLYSVIGRLERRGLINVSRSVPGAGAIITNISDSQILALRLELEAIGFMLSDLIPKKNKHDENPSSFESVY